MDKKSIAQLVLSVVIVVGVIVLWTTGKISEDHALPLLALVAGKELIPSAIFNSSGKIDETKTIDVVVK